MEATGDNTDTTSLMNQSVHDVASHYTAYINMKERNQQVPEGQAAE